MKNQFISFKHKQKKYQYMTRLNKQIIVVLGVLFFLNTLSFSENTIDAVSLYLQARDEQFSESFYRAIELYKTALKLNPNYVEPMKGLAECFYEINELDEALKYAQQAKQFDKSDMHIYNLLGMIYIGLLEFKLARDQFKYVLSVKPNNIEAQFGLAELDIADGKKREAAAKYLDTLRISPNNMKL